MSRDILELVRRAYDAWGRGDFRSTLDLYDPHVVVVHREAPEAVADIAGVYWGLDGLKEYTRKVFDAWSSATLDIEEIIEAGDSVVAATRMRAVGRAGGVPVELPYFHVWTFRGGSVIRFEVVPERAEALEAVGLPEHATSRENVAIVRRLYAGWEKGDFSVELDAYDPEVELLIDYGPDRSTARGFDAMRRTWREQLRLWDSWRTGPIERVFERGDHVVVEHALRARSKRGLAIESQHAGAALTFRDGRIVRIVATDDIRKALEAAGMRD